MEPSKHAVLRSIIAGQLNMLDPMKMANGDIMGYTLYTSIGAEEKEVMQTYVNNNIELTAKELIDMICPEHDRISCNDSFTNNGLYSNTSFTRCARCTLLHIIRDKKLPESHTAHITFEIEHNLAQEERL